MPDLPAAQHAGQTPAYQPTEIIRTDARSVACDGGAGVLGHPRVWLHIKDREVLCPYCSRLFVLNPGAGDAYGH